MGAKLVSGAFSLQVILICLLSSSSEVVSRSPNNDAYLYFVIDGSSQGNSPSQFLPLISDVPGASSFRVRRQAPTAVTTASNQTNSVVSVTTAKSISSVPNSLEIKVVNVVPIGAANTTTNSTAAKTTTTTSNSTTPVIGPVATNQTTGTMDSNSLDSPDRFPEYPAEFEYPKNYTAKMDTHKYYNSSYFREGSWLWVVLDDHMDSVKHELLSNAHRRAATVQLKFDFPFYGHMIKNVTMATGGFVYLGEQVHAWLAATQYVAPLMANFHSTWDNATVRYLSNATQFTVEWDHVHVHGDENHDSGPFTFQTTLYINGTIVFAYKDIPIDIKNLSDTHHPVKVGLSDAYITDTTRLFIKSRTIFEYDRVDLKDYPITNGSGIIFTPLQTCQTLKTCQECLSANIGFKCTWCPKAQRCSDGTDRHRQDWLIKACSYTSYEKPLECFMATTSSTTSTPVKKPTVNPSVSGDIYHNIGHNDGHDDHDHFHDHHDHEEDDHDHYVSPQKVKKESVAGGGGMSAGGVVALMFFFMILFGGGGWLFYAYYYPHSPSGQLLIRFRPSQWAAFRRGEARYTAASIHM